MPSNPFFPHLEAVFYAAGRVRQLHERFHAHAICEPKMMPEVTLQPIEELFRARAITFLVGHGPLPPTRAQMLRGACLDFDTEPIPAYVTG